jgi:hypothetical protein
MVREKNKSMKTIFKVITAQIVIAVLILIFIFNKPKIEKKLVEHKIPCEYLEARYESLVDSVSDLEQKAEILNRYLNMKHIEYMEVCDLVHKSKK